MQVRRWAEQVSLCKANRKDSSATEHSVHGVGWERHTCFLLPGWWCHCWGSSHLCSKEGVSVSGATSLPPLLQSSFHSRGSNFWYCTQKGNVYHWTVPSPQASSYYKHFDSFSSENILCSITSKDSTVIIILYNVLNSRGADMLR